MPNAPFKVAERSILRRYFGCERNPNDGSHQADGENEWAVIEIYTNKIPKQMLKELKQAEDGSARTGWKKLPLCVMHEKGKHHGDDIIFTKLKYWKDWYGT